MITEQYDITGMSCAACSSAVERVTRKLDGVGESSVNPVSYTHLDISVQMSYDTSFLRFVSGDGVNADSEGKLTYTGTGSGDRIEFKMTFQALQEGSTRINQDAETVTTTDGETLDCTQGFSDVTIAAGDPSKIAEPGKTAEVTIEGQQYTLSLIHILRNDEEYIALLNKEALENTWEEKARVILQGVQKYEMYGQNI